MSQELDIFFIWPSKGFLINLKHTILWSSVICQHIHLNIVPSETPLCVLLDFTKIIL